MSARVLIVEDDAQIAANIYDFLVAKGFSPDAAPNASVALHLLAQTKFDIVVLDLGLPGMGGLSLAQQFRQVLGLAFPIIVLTARDTLDDKQAAFDAGVDDYVLKPFALKELLMRINAQLRRVQGQWNRPLRFGDLSFDPQRGQMLWREQPLKLPPRTLQLLQLFLNQPETLFSREQLEYALWGEEQASSDALRYHISLLRKALLSADGSCPLQTVHGRGYMLLAHGGEHCGN